MIDERFERQNHHVATHRIREFRFARGHVGRPVRYPPTSNNEGYPGKRYYGGNQIIDRGRGTRSYPGGDALRRRARKCAAAFGRQRHVGVYLALLKPGRQVLGHALGSRRPLTTGSPVNFSGLTYDSWRTGLESDERIDFDNVREIANANVHGSIIAGATAYSRIIDPVPALDRR